MASLNEIYIKAETLRTLADTVERKGDKGLSLTISINDETNQYGQNISAYVTQTKEDREAGKKRYYAGNGRTFWTNGKIEAFTNSKPATNESSSGQREDDDLPY